MDFLIEKGILKCVHGRYPGLITGSGEKHGRNKPRWVEPPVYEKLLRLQEKLKVENKA